MPAPREHVRVACFAGIMVFAMSAQVIPPNLTTLADEFRLDHVQRGMVFAIQYAGFFITSSLGGWLSDRFGRRAFLTAGFYLTAAGLGVAPWIRSYPAFAVVMFCVGCGGGLVEVLVSLVLCDLFPERKGRVLNQNQIFYNVGAIAMPLVASWVLALNLGWRPGFVVAAVGCAACGLWINLLPAPVRPEAPGPDPTRGNDPSASVALLVALAAMMFLYVGGEMTAANWASNYLEETFGAGRAAAARVPALFWLCMLAGRLVYVAFVERWNYLWPILVSSLFAAAAGAAAVFAAADWQAVAAVAAVGLGLSGIWPTILAYASRRFPGRGYVFSVVVAVGSAGLLVFPPLCGLIAERSPWRLRAGMALIAATLAGVAALAGALLAVERSRGES